VTSATLDAERFSKYPPRCPISLIPCRAYPVEYLYTKEPETGYLGASLIAVVQIHLTEPPDDILLFLTRQDSEVDISRKIPYKFVSSKVPKLIALPTNLAGIIWLVYHELIAITSRSEKREKFELLFHKLFSCGSGRCVKFCYLYESITLHH
jgi:hypothetical protein